MSSDLCTKTDKHILQLWSFHIEKHHTLHLNYAGVRHLLVHLSDVLLLFSFLFATVISLSARFSLATSVFYIV